MATGGTTVGDPSRYADERSAVVGLALASLPQEDHLRRRLTDELHLTFPGLGESLERLTSLTTDDARLGHRTVGLRLLAKLASRRGMEPLQREAGRVRQYLRCTMDCTHTEVEKLQHHHHDHGYGAGAVHHAFHSCGIDAPIQDEAPEVQHMLNGLEAAAQRRAPSWHSFAPTAASSLQLIDEELGLPRCSDRERVPVGGRPSTRVVTWFSSDKPATEFRRWTDPRQWPIQCSLFFDSMDLVEGEEEPPDDLDASWRATFWEKVTISEEKTLTTPLTFTRTAMGPNLYALYFTLPPDTVTDDLLVDAGALVARQDPTNPPGCTTLLSAEKCLQFTDPALADWPTLLCDLFWMEFSILAALGCRHPDPTT